jgi:DNA-binding NarL/FixJ family response regulator
MQQASIILLQSDPNVAQMLSASLSHSFHKVHVAANVDELRHTIAKQHPFAVILDLESASLKDLESLKQEFRDTRIICNHRVADEEMWTRTLTAGADDCCPSYDTRSILMSAIPAAQNVRRDVAA